MKTTKKLALALAVVASVGLWGASQAQAAPWGFGIQIGPRYGYSGGHYGGYGHRSHRGHYDWHDTSHYDYHPGGFQRHNNHYHYVPGHYDYHRSGHWDYHRGGHGHRGHYGH